MEYKTSFNIIEDVVNDMLFDLEGDEEISMYKALMLPKEFNILSDKISTLKAIFIYIDEHPEKDPYIALKDFTELFYDFSKRGDKAYCFLVGYKILCDVLDIVNGALNK